MPALVWGSLTSQTHAHFLFFGPEKRQSGHGAGYSETGGGICMHGHFHRETSNPSTGRYLAWSPPLGKCTSYCLYRQKWREKLTEKSENLLNAGQIELEQ